MKSHEHYEAAFSARTQSLFRDVNERVREINTAFKEQVPLGDWVCECAETACTKRIGLTTPEYEAIRAHPRRFAVAASDYHVVDEIEDVVERQDRFWVVEKHGPAGELAEKVDPRRIGLRGRQQATA